MVELGQLDGVIVAAVVLINTIIAAVSVSRNKRSAAAYRWRKRMEPVHLDLLDWGYEVQMWAAGRGYRGDLPPLPASLRESYLSDDEEDDDTLAPLDLLRLQVERRDRS